MGTDVGKTHHFHTTLDDNGEQIATAALASHETRLRQHVVEAKTFGRPGLVSDQPGSITALVLADAQLEGAQVAYIPGLVMRRAAPL